MGKTKSFKITPKHRRFIRFYILTGNVTESGRLAGFNATYARDMVTYPAISNAIQEARLKAGLTDEMLERKHVELLHCGEKNVELGAMRLGYQVKKKIGSDEAPPPAVLPAVILRIEAGNVTSPDGSSAKPGRGLPADPAPRVSIRVDNKP